MISIIAVSFNCKDWIELLVKSVRKFTAVPHELLVVDNGSLDGGERVFCWNRDVSFVCDSRYRVTFAKRPGERDCVFILEEENE